MSAAGTGAERIQRRDEPVLVGVAKPEYLQRSDSTGTRACQSRVLMERPFEPRTSRSRVGSASSASWTAAPGSSVSVSEGSPRPMSASTTTRCPRTPTTGDTGHATAAYICPPASRLR